jgi:hypothetical protein
VNWLIGVLRSITELKVGLADVVDILTVALRSTRCWRCCGAAARCR